MAFLGSPVILQKCPRGHFGCRRNSERALHHGTGRVAVPSSSGLESPFSSWTKEPCLLPLNRSLQFLPPTTTTPHPVCQSERGLGSTLTLHPKAQVLLLTRPSSPALLWAWLWGPPLRRPSAELPEPTPVSLTPGQWDRYSWLGLSGAGRHRVARRAVPGRQRLPGNIYKALASVTRLECCPCKGLWG